MVNSVASVSLDVALCTPNVCNLDKRILNFTHFIIQSCGYLCMEVNSTVDRFIRLIISLIPCIYTLISPRGTCLFCVLNFRRLRSSALSIEVEMGHYPNLFQYTYTHTWTITLCISLKTKTKTRIRIDASSSTPGESEFIVLINRQQTG